MELGDKRDQLVLDNLKFVHFLLNKMGIYQNSPEYDDLFQIGTIGLIKAANTYDPSRKINFSTYSSTCINNEILMYYRKNKKYLSTLSLDDPIADDGKGKELTLSDQLSDPDSDFTEALENQALLMQVYNVILNYLSGKERLAVLYRLGHGTQRSISKTLDISQSYVSRIITKANQKIRNVIENQVKYKEIFRMTQKGDEYAISFSSKDISKFNLIFSALLQSLSTTKSLPNFKVFCDKEHIAIRIPVYPEALSFLAQIIQTIDEFQMSYISPQDDISEQQSISEDSEDDNETITGPSEETDMDTEKAASETDEELTSTSSLPAQVQETETVETELVNSKANDSTSTPPVKPQSQCKLIRDYMLSLERFNVKQLTTHFPDMPHSAISNAINSAKAKGLITGIARGEYIVNKN